MSIDDTHRQRILEFLNNYNNQMLSGSTTREVVIYELKKQGYDRRDTDRNLQFLIDEGWVKSVPEKRNGIRFEKIRIGSKGVNFFDKSKFAEKRFSSITLTGTNNVFVMGDNVGTITQNQEDSIDLLNELVDIIKASDHTEDIKREAAGDIETIKSQLIKPNPRKEIVSIAWASINTTLALASNISGTNDLIQKIDGFLKPWLLH